MPRCQRLGTGSRAVPGSDCSPAGSQPQRYVLRGPGIVPFITPATLPEFRALSRQARDASAQVAGVFIIEAVYGQRDKSRVMTYQGGRRA